MVTSSPGAVVPEEVTVAGRVAVHASGATDVACRRDAGDAEDTPRLVLTMQVAGTDGTAYLLTLTVAPEDRAGSFPVSPGEDSGRYARIDVDRAGLAAASPVLSGLSGTVTVSAGGRSIGVDARLVGADGQDAGVLTGRLRCP